MKIFEIFVEVDEPMDIFELQEIYEQIIDTGVIPPNYLPLIRIVPLEE